MADTRIILPEYYRMLIHYRNRAGLSVLEDPEIPGSIEVIDEYWIVPGFVKVQIRRDVETLRTAYHVIEPQIAINELELLSLVYEDVRRKLILKDFSVDSEANVSALLETLNEVVDEYALRIQDELTIKMLYYLFRNFFGFGAIDPLLLDPGLEDISCDGYDIPIYVFHSKYGGMPTNISFTKGELDSMVLLLGQKSGKHVSYASPLIDATLPDGSRIQLSYGSEVTTRGSTFTIRKFRADPFTPIDLIAFGTFTPAILAYYWMLVENKMSFMVIGETASGKTTTLNALMMFIPPEDKVISIEDTREIQLYHENWIPGVTRSGIEGREIDMYDLLRAALRQRPDYIIVGEVRGREAQTLFQAMATGHASYATFHSGEVSQFIYRLENEPLEVPRVMIQFLDSIIVQFMWVKRGQKKRRAREIVEIVGIDPANKELLVNPIFKWDPSTDSYAEISSSKKLEKIADILGASIAEVMDELKRREEFLWLMYQRDIRDYRLVTKLIHTYYRDPEKAFESIQEEVIEGL
jgi:flagellar protein FlaI